MDKKRVEFLVVDTTAFIQNAPLQDIAENLYTCSDVVDEIKNKRQLRRLAVLPYNLTVKDPFPENIKVISDFARKTGDLVSLSGTDIRVMALTYQLEKEKVGIDHIRTQPIMQKTVNLTKKSTVVDVNADSIGFYPGHKRQVKKSECNINEEDNESFFDSHEDVEAQNVSDGESSYETCSNGEECDEHFDDFDENSDDIQNENFNENEILKPVNENNDLNNRESSDDQQEDENSTDDDDEGGWITPSNIKEVKKQMKASEDIEDKHIVVGCMTTDFAMQNVLKQMNLNVCSLEGRVIKQLRTFILRCYSCFKTTSIMSKKFCPWCGNDTLKKVAVSLDENGKLQIHINIRRPLTGRGKKFSLPTFKGGKHPNNPIIAADQPIPQNRPSRLAKTKINPLEHDYVQGYSPFVTRDVNSRSALLGIRPGQEVKHWMRKNPNEARRKRK